MNMIASRMTTMLLASAALGASLLAVSAANADVLDTIKQRGKIIVAAQAESPGFSSMNAQGEFSGIDIDVANLYAKSLGVDIQFVPTNNQSRIASVQTGKVDMTFSALSMTPERAKSVQYSRPYAPNINIVVGPPGKAMPNIESMSGMSIGTSKGSTMDVALTKSAPADVTIRRFDDESAGMQAFLSGQVDAGAGNAFFLVRLNQAKPDAAEMKFPLPTYYVGAGMRQGETALNESINAFLDKAEADGSLAEIYKKWTGLDMDPLPKSVEGVPFTTATN